METKHCKRCGETKDVSLFYTIKSGKRAGKLHTYCRKCLSNQVMAIEARDPEKRRQRQRDWWATHPAAYLRASLRKYGVDEHWYAAKLAEQNGVCSICEQLETQIGKTKLDQRPYRLAVDHCHTTGKNRGLLCSKCNTQLGAIEAHDWLARAEAYLKKYRNP